MRWDFVVSSGLGLKLSCWVLNFFFKSFPAGFAVNQGKKACGQLEPIYLSESVFFYASYQKNDY
jgi:hypothetical protein